MYLCASNIFKFSFRIIKYNCLELSENKLKISKIFNKLRILNTFFFTTDNFAFFRDEYAKANSWYGLIV